MISTSSKYVTTIAARSHKKVAGSATNPSSGATSVNGYDPTQPLGGVGESSAASKRADYQRAQAACLQARGYSVK